MPPRCSYYMCRTRCSKTFKKPMFRFPIMEPKRLQRWLTNCGNMKISHFTPKELYSRYVCIDHFDKKSVVDCGRRVMLVPSAVPYPYKWEDSPSAPDKTQDVESDDSFGSASPGRKSPELRVLAPRKVYTPIRKQNGDDKGQNICHIKDKVNHNVINKTMKGKQKTILRLNTKKKGMPDKQCQIEKEAPRRRGRKRILKRKHSDTMEGTPNDRPAKSIDVNSLEETQCTSINDLPSSIAQDKHMVEVKWEPLSIADDGVMVGVKAEPIDDESPAWVECESRGVNDLTSIAEDRHMVEVNLEPLYESSIADGGMVGVKAEPIEDEPTVPVIKQELIEFQDHPPETELLNYKALYIQMKDEISSLKLETQRLTEQNEILEARNIILTTHIDNLQSNIDSDNRKELEMEDLRKCNLRLKTLNTVFTEDIEALRKENKKHLGTIKKLKQQLRTYREAAAGC